MIEKTPRFFIAFLKDALHEMEIKNGLNNQARAAHMLGNMARSMMKGGKPVPTLREILSELHVCCTRQSVR